MSLNLSSIENSLSTLQLSDSNQLDEKSAAWLFNLYSKFFGMQSEGVDSLYSFMAKDFASVEECDFNWKKLDVALPLEKMESVLEKTGVLQLRPISTDATTLVIGCGNSPIADAGGYPLGTDEESERYRKEHLHPRAITINPHLAHNPTLGGFFGLQKFPMLKDGQFDLIVIEGTFLPDTKLGRKELQRLIKTNGVIVSNFGGKEGYKFSWEENGKNVWELGYQMPPIAIHDLNVFESFNYQNEKS